MLPANEESAVAVVIRYFTDRGVICLDDEARRIAADARKPASC